MKPTIQRTLVLFLAVWLIFYIFIRIFSHKKISNRTAILSALLGSLLVSGLFYEWRRLFLDTEFI